MARKKLFKINIDKKRQCYNQSDELFKELSKYDQNEFIDYGDFYLHIIDNGRKEGSEKEPTKIKANVIFRDDVDILLGTFTFNNSAKYDGLCFFVFFNTALYRVSGQFNGKKYNYQTYLPLIADVLGLTLNNYTELEISCDVNFNPIPSMMKLIKDYENYEMYINGKKVTDENRIIDGYIECYDRSRKKRSRYPTLYFHQVKDNSPQMRIYDKGKEIKAGNNSKDYIEEWNNFSGTQLYRLEATIKNEDYKQWLQHVQSGEAGLLSEWGDFEASEGLLQDDGYLYHLWGYLANRLVYFKPKGKKQAITLLDIVEGAA